MSMDQLQQRLIDMLNVTILLSVISKSSSSAMTAVHTAFMGKYIFYFSKHEREYHCVP